jgi:hypothetical protein
MKCHTRFITTTEVLEKQRLKIADSTLRAEMELGFHPDSGNKGFKVPMYGTKVPLSPVLNHCHLIKASSTMAKEYLAFMKEAGCEKDDLDVLASKIEVFATAGDMDEQGGDENVIPAKPKKLEQMKAAELQAEAEKLGVPEWDKMNKKELVKEIKKLS